MTYLTDFDDYALEVVRWHDQEWPNPDGTPAHVERVCMKLCEEVGELHGALVKHLQGRTDKDWLDEAVKEFGDVQIVLCVLARRMADLHLAEGRSPEPTPSFVRMFRWRWFGRRAGDGGVSSRRGASYR
jgi:NTP pyrophosphatase (non-canonical NTP hydrolase)